MVADDAPGKGEVFQAAPAVEMHNYRHRQAVFSGMRLQTLVASFSGSMCTARWGK